MSITKIIDATAQPKPTDICLTAEHHDKWFAGKLGFYECKLFYVAFDMVVGFGDRENKSWAFGVVIENAVEVDVDLMIKRK
jgi:hypothetical protein